jgi:hypothetical protein
MTNRIRRVELNDQTVAPAGAEVWVTVHIDEVTPTTEVRGRLMGPTCQYSTTVEVAYPLRPLAKNQKPPLSEGPAVTLRVLIPEPSLWDPVSPFLYHGFVELWQDGRRVEQVAVRHGLRIRTLTPRGLRWNGKPLPLRCKDVRSCSEEEMLTLRSAGYNLLIARVSTEEAAALWERADRIGFLMLGRVAARDEHLAAELASHPSCLGFLCNLKAGEACEGFRGRAPVGLELDTPPAQPLPAGFDFVLCASEMREEMSRLGLSVLMRD